MRRHLVLLVLWVPMIAGSGWAAGPRLVVERTEFDFGEILQGTRVEHVFRLRNEGEAPLAIDRVRSSCGCTAAMLSASEILPGGSGEVRATFDSGRFRGPIEKTITLYTNEPTRPTSTLRIRGRVLPVLEARPAELDLGTAGAGDRHRREVALVNHGGEPIALTGVQTTSPSLQASLQAESIPPGGTAVLQISADAQGAVPLNGYVIVRTGSPRYPELRIGVYASPAPSR